MNRPAAAILTHMKLSTIRMSRLCQALRARIRLTLKGLATPIVFLHTYSAPSASESAPTTADENSSLRYGRMTLMDIRFTGITPCR
jgi:hypothetical protein